MTTSPPLPSTHAVTDPVTGLEFHELSHPWGHGVPAHPGFGDVQLRRQANHAENGVMSQRYRTVMHTGTHVNAPYHLVQRAPGIGELPLERFFGTGVVVDAEKQQWEQIEVEDLEKSEIRSDDIVILVTGWHRRYADSQEYFADAPGLSSAAAQYLVDLRVKLVGIDTANIDHPLATSLAQHRGGPTAKYLPKRYAETTGRDPSADFPDWNPAHRTLLAAGIPTIENVGGDVADLLDRRATFHCMPWRWPHGDACQVRLVAMIDPTGDYAVERGIAR